MLEIAGIAVLPGLHRFLAFTLFGLALNLTPGADMAYVVSSAARNGMRGGFLATLGIVAGSCIHIVAAVIGLSALLGSSRVAYDLLKLVGAGYLLFLAVQLIFSSNVGRIPDRTLRCRPGLDIFRTGALINIFNPKMALFFITLLPQFVDLHNKQASLQIFALGMWFNMSSMVVNCIIALATTKVAARLMPFVWLSRSIRILGGLCMGTFALRLLFSDRG